MTVAALLLGCQRRSPKLSSEALAAAMVAVRPGQERLIGEPWRKPRAPGARGALPEVVRIAERQARHPSGTGSSARSLHDRAVAWLLAGLSDRAVADFRQAVELRPGDGGLWADLAAAHLGCFESTGDPYELVAGLDAANQAVRRDPSSLVARFNRALALERLSLHALARAEWEAVAKEELDPAWRHEAQLHAAAMARPVAAPEGGRDPGALAQDLAQRSPAEIGAGAARSPAVWRQAAEENLLDRWAAAAAAGHEEQSAKTLSAIREVGAALARSHGEWMLADTVIQIDRSEPTPATIRQVVAGLLGYRRGLDLIASGKFGAALPVLRQARGTLARAGSPFAGWAGYQVAFCQYEELDYEGAQRELAELLRRVEQGRYRVLAGRAQLLSGLIYSILGRHREAIAAYGTALGNLRQVEQGALAVRASALLAEEQGSLGQRVLAWRTLYPALLDPAAQDRPELRQLSCVVAATLASSEGKVEVALQFHDEVVRNALVLGQPYRISGALWSRAELLAALGRAQEARADLDRAFSTWREIPDAATRRSMEGDLRLVEGTLERRESPGQALAAYDRAITLLRSTSYHWKLAQALFARAEIERATGRNAQVESDLLGSLAEAERQRETISSPADRVAYLEQMREVLETLIQIEVGSGRAREALAVSERGRARVLWDWLVAGPGARPGLAVPPPAPLASGDLQALERDLPARTAVLEYAVLRDRTVFWFLRRGRPLQCGTLPVGGAALDALVGRFRKSILARPTGDDNRAFQVQAEQLYEDLIRPVAKLLGPGERLTVVPDGALQVLPFSLLRDRLTDHFLIQDHALAVAPSLRALSASYRRDVLLVRQATRPRMLVVSAPDFDRALEPALAPLSGLDAGFASIFPGSRVLGGRAATVDSFLRLCGSFEIVHFGGHALVNTDSPLASRLLFARNPSAPGAEALYSGDVLRARFARTRIVVLASCGTALGRISGSEGVESLARPFLAAGVPVVVAALWDTDDRVANDLFARFYGALRRRGDAASALRSAVVEMIEHGSPAARSPVSWGGFEVIGCDAGDGGQAAVRK
jgi:CHAT domain-containing protein/tetratricopeptide (TPR) repeat protein